MSAIGTTWFKNSRRKLAAVVAGVALLSGAAGIAVSDTAVVEAAATRTVVVEADSFQADQIDEISSDKEADKEEIRRPRFRRGSFKFGGSSPITVSTNSTWS